MIPDCILEMELKMFFERIMGFHFPEEKEVDLLPSKKIKKSFQHIRNTNKK
jgi:hypothetical protein